MHKKDELLLRETIRQIVREEMLEEGKVTDFFKRMAGMPTYDERKLGFELDPKMWFLKHLDQLDVGTLGGLMRKLTNVAQETGSSFTPEVKAARAELQDFVVSSLRGKLPNPSAPMSIANNLAGAALAKAHGLHY